MAIVDCFKSGEITDVRDPIDYLVGLSRTNHADINSDTAKNIRSRIIDDYEVVEETSFTEVEDLNPYDVDPVDLRRERVSTFHERLIDLQAGEFDDSPDMEDIELEEDEGMNPEEAQEYLEKIESEIQDESVRSLGELCEMAFQERSNQG